MSAGQRGFGQDVRISWQFDLVLFQVKTSEREDDIRLCLVTRIIVTNYHVSLLQLIL